MDQRGIGMAIWLLSGRLGERVAWVVQQGMGGVALLQSMMDHDAAERTEAAQAMRDAGLVVTYHCNVQSYLQPDGRFDDARLGRLMDDVLWWDENAGGVRCCCADPVISTGADGTRRFDPAINEPLVRRLGQTLGSRGMMVGIENGFGAPGGYGSIEQIEQFAARCAGVPGLAILLDTGHVNVHLKGQPGIGDFIRSLPLPIAEVHVTDNRGVQDEHRHVGYGTLDVADMAAALCDVGYAGPLTIEVCKDILNRQYASDITNPEETAPLLQTRDRLAAIWPPEAQAANHRDGKKDE